MHGNLSVFAFFGCGICLILRWTVPYGIRNKTYKNLWVLKWINPDWIRSTASDDLLDLCSSSSSNNFLIFVAATFPRSDLQLQINSPFHITHFMTYVLYGLSFGKVQDVYLQSPRCLSALGKKESVRVPEKLSKSFKGIFIRLGRHFFSFLKPKKKTNKQFRKENTRKVIKLYQKHVNSFKIEESHWYIICYPYFILKIKRLEWLVSRRTLRCFLKQRM